MRTSWIPALAVVLLAGTAACGEGLTTLAPDSPLRSTGVVSQVVVTPNPVSLSTGQNVQLTARAYDANGVQITGKTATWSSSSPSVASVSASGVVTGNAGGSATIYAGIDGVYGSASANVTAAVPLTVSINGPQFIHSAGSYLWEAVPSGGNGTYSYTWTLEVQHSQPTFWGTAPDVGMYVDSGSSPYLYWTVTVTSGGQTAYAEKYVCNFTASAMC
jgi:hypothetical protein